MGREDKVGQGRRRNGRSEKIREVFLHRMFLIFKVIRGSFSVEE